MYAPTSTFSKKPPTPVRSFSASTTNTTSSSSSALSRDTERTEWTSRAASPSKNGMTPSSPVSSAARYGESRRASWDEVDKLGYTYSLRVAILHQTLSNPGSSSRLQAHGAGSPIPSPALGGTSPSGSRLTLNLSSPKSPSWPTPPPAPASPNLPSPAMSRRKSAFNLGKKKDDVLKLPKEFLLEFWQTLAGEQGDADWSEAVSAFLGMVKKGTKTPSGLNLREIPILLDTFSQTIPSTLGAHIHQSHFLQLLYNSLPRSTYFSPIARNQSEKDRDMLFRLRAEVQTYMLVSSPSAADDLASSGFHSPPPRSSTGLGLGRTYSAQSGQSGHSAHSGHSGPGEIKRKPSPLWLGEDLMDTVALVWGMTRETVELEVEGIKRSGPIEQVYMSDLRSIETFLSALPSLSQSQRARQQSIENQINTLISSFPDLQYANASPQSSLFFTPPRQSEVFARLAARASEAGHGSKTRDLVERCREIWGVESRREKEKELEQLMARWQDTIGTREEVEWGQHLAEAVRDLTSSSNDTSPILDTLLDRLLDMLGTSAGAIFPTTDLPPTRPAPSLLPILSAGLSTFMTSPKAKKAIEELSDELKALSVGEYVAAAEHLGGMAGSAEGDSPERFENVGAWIEREIKNVQKSWGRGLGSAFNPAAIILSRQFPLFCAELQSLAQPSGRADMFKLYEITGRLAETWDELCPGQEHGLELNAFFEPHVAAWLRDTESNTTQDWVSRAVGMDSWVPEGENKHSQSVIDLFEFIRGTAQVILHDLPLGEYRRAMYLIDLSKTVSVATSQYASTVGALFAADMNPAKAGTPTGEMANKLESKLGGKASSWLAKGQQAVKSMEKKKVDGFIVPPTACVKLTDMGAAQICLDDLVFALEAEETARIVKQNKAPGVPERSRHIFSVTIMRGEGILTKGMGKGADGFVTVVDKETGERLIKTRTVLGQEDPRWEQSFEVSVGQVKTLELAVYDRTLVGKHDLLGTASFRLDPRSYAEVSVRDALLPLTPRGNLHVRISMEGGEKHDVAYHLGSASRALDRTASDMVREIVDKIGEYMRVVLSPTTLAGLTKPLKDKKKPRTALSEEEIERSLGPLFAYLNENFAVFSVTLTDQTRLDLLYAIWVRLIDTLIGLLVPPLSDKPYTKEILASADIDVIFKWLTLLKQFFNASERGVEYGVPMSKLQSGNYKDLVMLGQYMDLPSNALRERCAGAVKSAGGAGSKGVDVNGAMGAMGLGGGVDNDRMAEILLRIARTRMDMGDFLTVQCQALTRARVERQAGSL